MSSRRRKVLQVMGGIFIALAATFPDALSFLKMIATSITTNPIRAALIIVGLGLVVSAFWDEILDAAGVHSNERLLAKTKEWLHSTFGYSLIETTRHDNTFTLITEFKGNRFTITKDALLPTLSITSTVRADEFKEIVSRASTLERGNLREDIILELARLNAFKVSVTSDNGILETSITHKIVLTKDFDEFRLVEGIGTVGRGITLIKRVFGKWVTGRLQIEAGRTAN